VHIRLPLRRRAAGVKPPSQSTSAAKESLPDSSGDAQVRPSRYGQELLSGAPDGWAHVRGESGGADGSSDDASFSSLRGAPLGATRFRLLSGCRSVNFSLPSVSLAGTSTACVPLQNLYDSLPCSRLNESIPSSTNLCSTYFHHQFGFFPQTFIHMRKMCATTCTMSYLSRAFNSARSAYPVPQLIITGLPRALHSRTDFFSLDHDVTTLYPGPV
jgi:hypothetical protein